MRVAVTGTPGTGKTSATGRLDRPVVHLNEVIEEEGFHEGTDPERGSYYADMERLAAWVDEREAASAEPLVVESHLAHDLPADRVVVLRCHPEELVERLRERGEEEATCDENAEAEALDIVLSEAVARHGREAVYEIDTTGRSPDEVAADVAAAVAGERAPGVGEVSFVDWL